MVLKYLIRKELIQLWRNGFLPRLVVLFPVMVMGVMPWIMTMEVRNVRVSVVDNDRSTLSSRLVHGIEASRYFVFHARRASYAEALTDIERSAADVVVSIPPHYGRDVERGGRPQILLAANAANATKGAMGTAYLTQMVTAQAGPAAADAGKWVSELYLYNKHLDYKVFMIPALMAMVLVMMCGFLPALNIVGEKETGTIEQINVTPVSKWSFILAKLIPYWAIALLVVTLCFLLSWAVYGITCRGNILWLYVLTALLALVMSGIGLTVSNYSDTMQQAVFVMWFCVVCFMLLSGLYTPVRSMPDWAQMLVTLNPLHYFIDAMRSVFVRGSDFGDIRTEVAALALFALVADAWAVASYRKVRR